MTHIFHGKIISRPKDGRSGEDQDDVPFGEYFGNGGIRGYGLLQQEESAGKEDENLLYLAVTVPVLPAPVGIVAGQVACLGNHLAGVDVV